MYWRSLLWPVLLVALVAPAPDTRQDNSGKSKLDGLSPAEEKTRLVSLVMRGTVSAGLSGATGKLSSERNRLEISLLLPDCYLRAEQSRWFEMWAGLNRGKYVQGNRTLAPGVTLSANYGSPGPAVCRRAFALLAFGLMGHVDEAGGFALRDVGRQPRAYRLVGPEFNGVVDVGSEGLPQRIRFQGEARFPRPLTAEERRAGIIPPLPRPEKCEIVIAFEDRRREGGVLLPHAIRTTARGVPLEEMSFDAFVVNPPLSPETFERSRE